MKNMLSISHRVVGFAVVLTVPVALLCIVSPRAPKQPNAESRQFLDQVNAIWSDSQGLTIRARLLEFSNQSSTTFVELTPFSDLIQAMLAPADFAWTLSDKQRPRMAEIVIARDNAPSITVYVRVHGNGTPVLFSSDGSQCYMKRGRSHSIIANKEIFIDEGLAFCDLVDAINREDGASVMHNVTLLRIATGLQVAGNAFPNRPGGGEQFN